MSTDEESLVIDNMELAYNIAWKYTRKIGYLIDYDDLQSLALLGLVKAAKSYDKELGFSFSTYAYKLIKNEILAEYYHMQKAIPTISIYEPYHNDILIADILTIEDDTDILLDNYTLEKAIEELPEKLQIIIRYRLKNYTLDKIGKILGVCKQQISRDYQKALNLLRDKLMRGDDTY